jgi:hypothetical protein
MRQTERPTVIEWLHRHVFRGFALLFIAGMGTILFLAIQSRCDQATASHVAEGRR